MISLMTVCLLCVLLAQAHQDETRVLKKESVSPTVPEPLAIFNLQIDGKPISFDENFLAGDEWVKGLSFDLKNTSGKVITHFQIGIRLPAPQPDKPGGLVHMMAHGSYTALPGVEPTVRMMPGDEIHATYSDKSYESFKRMRNHIGLTNVAQVTVGIDVAMFEDNTMWRHGELLRQDPSNPRRWVVIGREHLIPKPSQSPVTSLDIKKGSSVTVAPQSDAPMLISLRHVFASDPLKPQIDFQLENISGKPVRAFSIRCDEVGGDTERKGLVNDHVVESPYLIQPGQWQEISYSAISRNSEPFERITLSVDFVEFEDGARWGADSFKSSDRIAGRRAGAEAERNRLIKIMAQSGIDAVLKAMESGAAELPQGNSAEWEQTFREGAKAVATRVQIGFNGRGAAAVESLLKQPVTKLIYEF